MPDAREGAEQIAEVLSRFEPLPEHYSGWFYRFSEALRSGGEVPVTLGDARRSVEMITAMYCSSQTGTSVALRIGVEHPRYASRIPAAAG